MLRTATPCVFGTSVCDPMSMCYRHKHAHQTCVVRHLMHTFDCSEAAILCAQSVFLLALIYRLARINPLRVALVAGVLTAFVAAVFTGACHMMHDAHLRHLV